MLNLKINTFIFISWHLIQITIVWILFPNNSSNSTSLISMWKQKCWFFKHLLQLLFTVIFIAETVCLFFTPPDLKKNTHKTATDAKRLFYYRLFYPIPSYEQWRLFILKLSIWIFCLQGIFYHSGNINWSALHLLTLPGVRPWSF